MRLRLATLSLALLAGSFEPAIAQAKAPAPPDPAMVTRLQGEIAKNEAKGDFKSAALELRILAGLYRNDPAMRSITYSQLAQVSTQLHDDAKADDRALAQGVPPHAAAVPAVNPFTAPQATATPFDLPPSAAPAPQPATGSTTSATDKLTKIMAAAQQIIAQAKQAQQAMKQKGANTPGPNPPAPNSFPAAPDGLAAAPDPQPPLQAPAEVSPAAGVVIGYDANNQPIFATPQPAPGTSSGQTPPLPQYPAPPR